MNKYDIVALVLEKVEDINDLDERLFRALELLEEYKYECGDIHFELNFNNLAWFGYEECVRQLANELEIEW